MLNNTTLFNQIHDEIKQLSYRELQAELKWFRERGATSIKLNHKKFSLSIELGLIVYNIMNEEVE